MNETRKLAAIMFTDLEGYTSLFQQDEASALRQIDIHRRTLDAVTQKHHGQISNFYGDGSLVIFDSVIDAVQSAIELQEESRKYQVPLRIGLHQGDIVSNPDGLFGNVINIASRIQATGVPNAVLLSQKVADELINHPGYPFRSIGRHHLKNVDQDMELFALVGHGLTVPPAVQTKAEPPKRKSKLSNYMLGGLVLLAVGTLLIREGVFTKKWTEDKIIIPPFEDFTGDPNYEYLSHMVSDWITTELIESAGADIVSFQSGMYLSNGDFDLFREKPNQAFRIGCKNLVKGAYGFLNENKDSLVFWASVVNTRTLEPLPVRFNKAYCDADEPMQCIRTMSDIIKGYWRSRDDRLMSVPTDPAYRAYLEARLHWGGPNEDEAKPYLVQAIRLDTTFLDPYLMLLDVFYNLDEPQHAIDTLKLIRSRFKDLTPRQENYIRYHEADWQGKRKEAWTYYEKTLSENPDDFFLSTSGMVMSNEYLNQPERTLELFDDIDPDSLDLNTCDYCRTRLNAAILALTETGQYERATKMAARVQSRIVRTGEYLILLHLYMAQEDTTAARVLIDQAERDTKQRTLATYLKYVAGREAILAGKATLAEKFARASALPFSNRPGDRRLAARTLYLLGDLDSAKTIYEALIVDYPESVYGLGELGMIYARQQNIADAKR